MDTQTPLGFQELITALVGNMTRAVSERSGDTPDQRLVRVQAGAQMIMAFLPRDVIEAMLAGHCVMFHELLTDSVRQSLRGAADPRGRATRDTIALNKAFFLNLDRFEQYRTRLAEGRRDGPEARAETRPVDPTAQPVPARTKNTDVPVQTRPAPVSPARPATQAARPPSPEAIAAVSANAPAMATLNAGDPAAFARALGVEQPSEAFPAAAAAPGSPFDRTSNGPRPEYVAKDDPGTSSSAD